jgi:hypothetical protein
MPDDLVALQQIPTGVLILAGDLAKHRMMPGIPVRVGTRVSNQRAG